MIPGRRALVLLALALALATLAALACGPTLARGDEALVRAAWLAGELPGWDPHTGTGRPLLGASVAGAWYPPQALALLVPLRLADALRLALALFLAGAGTWLWHVARFGARAALVDALAAELAGACGAVVFGAAALDAVLWAPWMLWAVEGLRAREPRAALRLAAASALALLAGPSLAGAIALGLALLAALLRSPRALPWIALGVLAAAVAWVPRLENRGWSAPAGAKQAPVLLGDPQARLFQRREAPDRLDVEIESEHGGRLVLREAFHPGWKAAIQGEDAEVLRTGEGWRALDVPPGHVIVRTKFESGALRLGAWTSCAALVLALLLARVRRLA